MDIIFRRMTEADVNDMADLEAMCFSQPWSRSQIAFELENPKAVYFCAVAGDKTVGFVGMHDILGEGYITNVAVNEQYRRMGIAKKLIDLLCEYGKEHSLEFITLEVRVSNSAAISLYEKAGFKTEGTRKRFYCMPEEDAFIMTKRY